MGISKNQKGFGAVEALLILVIVGIISGAGWYVMKANKNIDNTNNKTAASTSAPAAKKSVPGTAKITPTTSTSASANTYAGWKTYCDSVTSGCFRYPSDWSDISGPQGATALSATPAEDKIASAIFRISGSSSTTNIVWRAPDSPMIATNGWKTVARGSR